ncbi:MAG: trigger factor [Candidatus Izimaplasma sp.]|nr:trigger factor [Candidatus Izimaplasma bacterium]
MSKLEKLSDSKVKLEVEVSPESFEHGLDHAFNQIKDDVEIKGFRKGKVTRKVYEQHKGVESLYNEAINHAIQEAYADAVQEYDVAVVAQPNIDLDVTKVEKGKGFTFTAEVAVKPDVQLGDYKGLKFEKQAVEVTEEEIDAEVDKLLQQNAELVLKEEGTLEESDTAIFDFEGFVDGEPFEGGKSENYELKIGSGQFIPGFEEKMIGMKEGEEKEIEVSFPEDYQAENLKGKDATFKVKLHEMKVKEVPELSDEFVKEMDNDLETVKELKEDAKERLTSQKEEENKNARVDFAVSEATKNATFELPLEMIEQEQKRLMDNVRQQAKQYNLELDQYLQFSGMKKEDFESKLMDDAEKSVSYNLVVEQIGLEEGIDATEEEITAKYKEIADQYNMELEQVKQAVNPAAVAHEVKYRKTIDFLVDNLDLEA